MESSARIKHSNFLPTKTLDYDDRFARDKNSTLLRTFVNYGRTKNFYDSPRQGMLLALPTSTRLGRNGLPRTNTLAYYGHS